MYSIDEKRLRLEYSQIEYLDLLKLSITLCDILQHEKEDPFAEPQDLNEYLIHKIVALQREQKTVDQAIRYLNRFIQEGLHDPVFPRPLYVKISGFYEYLLVPKVKDENA